MSIPIREGFVDETLERCLEDLLVRFVLNCPEEDLSSIERVLFQIEEAHWFYQDFLRTLNPLLPSMKMKLFTIKLIEQCPLVWKWGDPSEALSQFGKYKSTIPVRGCALLNPSMTKILLVKGIESPSWGFPRGKISKDESDVDCALRELDEETGFDASDMIQDDVFVERTIKGKNYKIFIIKGVPEDYNFAPKVRYEISEIRWMDIKHLTKAIKTTNNFYLVGSMIKSIIAYINRVKKGENDDELKILATAQLKKILGIDNASSSENESADPGRELLALLKSVGNSGATNLSTASNPMNSQSQENLKESPNFPTTSLPLYQQMFSQHPPNLFLPPHLLAYQHNRMIPINHHSPFPLQMFNPYYSFSPYEISQMNTATTNGCLISQEMSSAPSVSTLPKPQFVQRPNPQNARELLNVLKKPPTKETKRVESAELPKILKKDDLKSKSPISSASSSLISILKKQPVLRKDVTEDSRPKERKKEREVIDITKPANDSTSRDITSSISDDKPVVLLRKGLQRSQLIPDNFSSSVSDSVIKSNIPTSEVQIVTNSDPKTGMQLLNESSKLEKNDPSSQLLNILQRKKPSAPATPLSLNDTSSNEIGSTYAVKNPTESLYLNPSSPTAMTNNNSSITPETSKYLLDIVKSKEKQPLKANNASSADLLNILKAPHNAHAPSNPNKKLNESLKDTSLLSLQKLKSLNSQSDSKDPSKNLLDLLKTQHNSTVTHKQDKKQSTQLQTNDLSTKLLNVLKNPESQISRVQQNVLENENNETNVLPSNFTNVLKNIDIPPTSAIESFRDFDDWDVDDSDGYEDAAEYVNDVLYE